VRLGPITETPFGLIFDFGPGLCPQRDRGFFLRTRDLSISS